MVQSYQLEFFLRELHFRECISHIHVRLRKNDFYFYEYLVNAWKINNGSLFCSFIYQRKNKEIVPLASIEQNKRNTFEDYEIDNLTTEPTNFTLHKESEGREGETKQSVLVDCDIQNDDAKGKGFIERENEKDDSSSDEEETEEDLEFDKLMKHIKMNLRSRKQGGLATIGEEEEDGEREYYLKVFEEKIKSFSIEKKMKYKDHILEIMKVYRCYQQKMRKLDVLNYQALYAIGKKQIISLFFLC